MKHTFILSFLLFCAVQTLSAQHDTIDVSGNNTSSSYVSYDKAISIPLIKTVDVLMARYCYFSSTIAGQGTLNLYAGGERCYLGTAKGASWPNWKSFKGKVHIYPYTKNSPSAGFYGVVLAHGGKSFSPEEVEAAINAGKVNNSLEQSHVVLHNGATICNEGSKGLSHGFRIGELNTEKGSVIQGYMKKDTRGAYYIVGSLGTNATLAGKIAPPDYSDTHPVGLIKEGKGTYWLTGNENYLSGGLRLMEGRVLVSNDRAEAEQKKLRGALGARPNDNEAIAYIFEKGILGGTGSIGGTVDNYGTIEPGNDSIGTLTLQNYQTTTKKSNLVCHPSSVLRFKVASANSYDQLHVNGTIKYSNVCQDFSTSEKMPVVQLALDETIASQDLEVGTELCLLTSKSKTGSDWHFQLQQPGKYTWELREIESNSTFSLMLRLVSLKDADANDPDQLGDPDNPASTMGAYYDDGIDDAADQTPLRTYAAKNNKQIGIAIASWQYNLSNASQAETKEIGSQFSMLVAENEMKMEALQPNRGEFVYGGADALVSFAQRNQMTMRGHCLVWHMQQPGWLSSDGKKNDKNWSRAEALAIMKSHIENVMGHFKGKITEWDVVNECLKDDQTIIRTNPNGYELRQTVWQQAIGDDYIDSAFVYAHRADPSVELYLNDYDVEQQGKAKAVAFYNLVKHLQERNIPIHGVGLQSHFSIGEVDSVKLESTIRRFGEAGLKCIITELDMGVPSTSAQNLEEQARHYRMITDIVLNNDNCPHFVVWGLKDNDSWRSASNPLLYTAGVVKKPAYFGLRSALRHRALQKELSVPFVGKDGKSSSPAVYDLSGRLVGNHQLRSGLYISRGKKMMVSQERLTY